MNKISIIVTSTQYPGFGGGATNSYAIIGYLRKRGYHVCGIFFHNEPNQNFDPENFGNIFQFPIYHFTNPSLLKIHQYRQKIINIMPKPSIILSKNYLAPFLANILFPKVPNVYMITGMCNMLENCNRILPSNIDDIDILEHHQNDVTAFNLCDVIVSNSDITHKIMLKTYPEYVNKLYHVPIDTSQYIQNIIKDHSCDNKIYDIIIVTSDMTRMEKNMLFLVNVLNNPIMNTYSKLIIGKNSDIFMKIPNSKIYDLISHKRVCELLAMSKVLLIPSLYESNPNIVREAYQMKCLILMSNNTGYHNLFPEFSICRDYRIFNWIEKTINMITNYDKIIIDYKIRYPDTSLELDDLIAKYL